MKEKTKELADSVGAIYPVMLMGRHDGVLFTEAELEAFVALVAAAEREEIAKLADASVNADQYPTLTMLAQAIRMRGD
jgi:hypothetical protein